MKKQPTLSTGHEVAVKIAALHGTPPRVIRVEKMVGSEAVQKFVRRIERAQKQNFRVPRALD